jgi:hypothetical protein
MPARRRPHNGDAILTTVRDQLPDRIFVRKLSGE